MENGTSIAKNAELGELSYKDVLESNLDGVKESYGEEVVEKAVEAERPAVNSEDSTLIGDGNVEGVGSLENGEEDSHLATEIQKFEEFISAPGGAEDLEGSGAKAEILINEEIPGETPIASGTVARDETNGFLDESNGDDSKVDVVEVFESAAAGDGTGSMNDGYEVNKELDTSPQKAEGGLSYNESSAASFASEEATLVIEDTENESANEMSESLKDDKLSGAETDHSEMDKIVDVISMNGGDIGSKEPENGTIDLVTSIGAINQEKARITDDDTIEEQSHTKPPEVEHDSGLKLNEDGPRIESASNGDVIHNDEKNFDEANAIQGSGHQQETINSSSNQHLELKEDQVGEQVEISSTSGANLKDDENNEPNELDSGVQPLEVDSQVFDKEENMGIAASDTSDIEHAKESSGLQTNLPPVVEDGTANLEIEKVEKPHFSSSELVADSLRSSQPRSMDAGIEVSAVVAEGPEKGSVKDDMVEKNVSRNRAQEDGPSTVISTSSGDSSTSATYPAAPKVQAPISEDRSVNGEQVMKPAANISAANSVARPAGLGHTSPLLEPVPQNTSGSKVSGPRSANSIPSTNVAPAAPARPAGLGNAAPLLEPASRVAQQPRVNGATSPHNQLVEDNTNGESEEYDETREKLQMIRVKFLRLAHRLGQTPHNVVVAQVLYRLGLAEQLRGRSGGRVGAFSFDRASAMAEQLEAAGQEPLDFTCTIMVLGKSGVGKSATINSIFDEVMFGTDAFQLGTKKVQDIVGTVQGIRVRVIDTPGLLPSWSDQRQNEKILHSVKRFIKKTPPDIILYLDRLDMQSRDFGDMPLLRTITDIFGPSIWFNAIVVLTHAASAPPEGPNGTVTSYDMFVTQRSHVVQQAIRQAAGDMRLMNPVSLVENHSACRTNRAGQRVLPNGQVWKPHLLLLSFASKILAEANTLLKLQDSPPGRPFAPRTRSPPLPFLLSSLLQSRPEVKLPSEQFGDDDDTMDDDLDECSDSDDDAEYDELPPFKSLNKAQLEKLTKAQRKGYYDELEYREKLLMKKQLKEEKRRRKMMKKMQEAAKNLPVEYGENAEEDTTGAASVPVPMPDMALPASFDSDNPTHRYRSLDSSNQWLVRAVLEPNGWDHDIGYDGINVERLFVVKEKVPISFSGHVSKDKKDANLQMEVASSVKHGKGKSTSLGFDMQSVGKDMAYTIRSETRLSNHRINKAAAGFSATLLGDVLTGGVKVEDKLIVGKRAQIVVAGGAIYGRGDAAYGGSLEATLRDKDYPLGRFLSTLGVSVMDWHGDLAIGCNSQTQIPVGRHTNLVGRFNINNKGSGQVSVRINSSEQLQIVLIGLIPLVKKILG